MCLTATVSKSRMARHPVKIMSESSLQSTAAPPAEVVRAETSRKAAKEAASAVTLTAFFGIGGLAFFPSWPLAVGVVGVSAMVAVACYFMLSEN